MKVIITKKQYKNLAFSVLENIVGDLKLDSKYIPGEAFMKVFDSYGENIMDVWLRKSAIPQGCKKELNVSIEISELIFSYLPLVRKKIFSEVFLEYFYMKTKYKCDCVDFYYPIDKKDENDDFVYRKFTYKKKKKYIKESVKDSNIVEKILEMAEIKYEGCGFGGRTYDNFGRKVDTVEMYFKFPNESKLRSRSIHFITRNNKVVTVESSSDFRTLYHGLSYIPELNLMEYFIEKAKTYLERILRYEYPSDNLKIQESVDKNKKFLIDIMGIDFTDKIQQITSSYDVPMEFDEGIGSDMVNRMLHFWGGPMYLVNINGKKYLYQDRGDYEWFLDKEGYDFVDGEILEELGIGVMGLRFSDIIDMFFDEEKTTLNENVDKNKKFLIDYLGEDFINGIEQITSQYDIPYELKSRLDYLTLRRMMNFWGPMYLVNINGKKYLYQDRDDYEWFMDNEGGSYVDGEILEEIGIGVMGLKFSHIIDIFFNED